MTMWWAGAYGPDMEGTAAGIGLLAERADGGLEWVELAAEMLSPTYLARRGDHLYAVAEGTGHVHSFRVEGTALEPDGVVPSGGGWPCQIEFVADALVISNYENGTVGVVSLEADGSVSELTQVLEGSGYGPHPNQAGPHTHAALLLDDATVVTADLGADRLLLHRVERGEGGTALVRTGEVVMRPGTGPRDIVRHPSGLIYVLGEHGRDLSVFAWDGAGLELRSTLPLPGAEQTDQAAAIGFGPGGLVYAGLRGSNRISVMAASPAGDTLDAVGWVASGGAWPRHLVVSGDRLHVSNQESSQVATFALRPEGLPQLVGEQAAVPSPTFLLPV